MLVIEDVDLESEDQPKFFTIQENLLNSNFQKSVNQERTSIEKTVDLDELQGCLNELDCHLNIGGENIRNFKTNSNAQKPQIFDVKSSNDHFSQHNENRAEQIENETWLDSQNGQSGNKSKKLGILPQPIDFTKIEQFDSKVP